MPKAKETEKKVEKKVEEKKLILNSAEFNKFLNVLATFQTLSKYYNSDYTNMVRLYSSGNGILEMIVNNFDLKMAEYITIEDGVKLDKLYLIEEIYGIVNTLKSYESFRLDSDVIYFDDGKISVKEINLEKETKDEVFPIDLPFYDKNAFKMETALTEEIAKIFKITEFRTKKARNYYYFDGDDINFYFHLIKVKKTSAFNMFNSDIFSLKIINSLFSIADGQEVFFNKNAGDNKFVFNSDDWYVEGHNLKISADEKQYMNAVFKDKNEKTIATVKTKLELLNFASIVCAFDVTSSLFFEKDKVKANSSQDYYQAVFNLTDEIQGKDSAFIIGTETLVKILKFIMAYEKKIESFEFRIVKNAMGAFARFDLSDMTIYADLSA